MDDDELYEKMTQDLEDDFEDLSDDLKYQNEVGVIKRVGRSHDIDLTVVTYEEEATAKVIHRVAAGADGDMFGFEVVAKDSSDADQQMVNIFERQVRDNVEKIAQQEPFDSDSDSE